MGGVVPNVVTNVVAEVAPEPIATEDLVAKAQTEVNLDSTSPTTQLQIRLQDGNRLVGRFNHNHTLSIVRNFIVRYFFYSISSYMLAFSARPELAFSEFQLMSMYPNKVSCL